MAARKSGLGKGLEALFVDNSTTDIAPNTIRISEIEPNQNQPRKIFESEPLAELADSIREHGILQPLLVRPLANGRYQIVAGERRWRAARMAGLSELPVVIAEMSDEEAMERALIENLQREDLGPLEEAEGYRQLMDTFGMTQDQVAKRVGKSRPAVANALRLLTLPPDVSALVDAGKLSAGHARTLLMFDSAEISAMAKLATEKNLSVRELEKLAGEVKRESRAGAVRSGQKMNWGDPYYYEMELALGEQLGCKVSIKAKKDSGTLEIKFANREELAEIARRLVEL